MRSLPPRVRARLITAITAITTAITAITTATRRITARSALVGVLVVGCFGLGYLGQGHWRIGARAAATAVSASAVEVIGGGGTGRPVRLLVFIAVVNQGSEPIRVLGPDRSRPGVETIGVEPLDLTIGGRRSGRLNATLAVDCTRPDPLQIPSLRIAGRDAVRRTIAVGGAGVLLEACGRSGARVRPLTIGAVRVDGGQLVVGLSSPTGRATRVFAVRAGGVPLRMDRPLDLAPTADARLSPPGTCPAQWLVGGIPTALDLDVATAAPAADGATGPSPSPGPPTTPDLTPAATLRLRLGAPLISWLLSSACRGGP
jgi:hypothetical protein